MKTYNYPKSQAVFKRAAKVIPCGIYGHYSPAPLGSAADFPLYTSRAKGSRFWDIDGNEFIDYICAYGPMVLGYNNPAVENAAMKQMKLGDCTTNAGTVMVDLAEYLVHMTPGMSWAFFAKNGGDVTNYSLMVARAATGRKKIVKISGGYHGVSPWMQAPGHNGTVEEDYANIISIPWNDVKAFESAIEAHPGDIAGFIATPHHVQTFIDNELPAKGYWKSIESLCRKNGIVLISDDIRHGFRHDLRGTSVYYGFKPDLICYCKAIANGHPISALIGTDEMKTYAASVFHTGSYWFQAVPMAAALASLKELKKMDGPSKMLAIGKKLLDGLVKIANSYGYNLLVSGTPSMPNLRITNDESMILHQEWCAECTKRGAYFVPHHNWFVSAAHTDSDIKKTLDIADEGFKVIKKRYGSSF